jgi:iron(III) transport system substrate-binding protein
MGHRLLLLRIPLFFTMTALVCACGEPGRSLPPEEVVKVPAEGTVVVYVEAPRRLAGPVLKTFAEQTGIEVKATYRENLGERFLPTLETEARGGKIDIFWAETPLSARTIAEAGLAVPFRPAGARPVPEQYRDRAFLWIGFAVNPRVIIYNSSRLKKEDAPTQTTDLVRPPWAGKGALPRIGSGPAAFHAAALFALWGPERARQFLEALRKDDGTRIVEDDRAVRQLVAEGGADWGVVGLDQGICSKREAEPVNILFPDRLGQGAIVPPETAVLLRGAPHPAQAKGLFGYLFATETGFALGQNDCALISLIPDVPRPDWVPALGAFNVARIDTEAVWQAYRENASYFETWGSEQAPAAAPQSQPRAEFRLAPRP